MATELWQVVHDGPSRPMIQSPQGRIFCVKELGAEGKQWGHLEDEDEFYAMLVKALNGF